MTGSGRRLPDIAFYGGVSALMVLLIFVSRSDIGLIRGIRILLGGTLLVGTIVAVVWVAWHLWQKPTTPTALELSRRFEAVRSMDGARFEVFVADLFGSRSSWPTSSRPWDIGRCCAGGRGIRASTSS